MALTRRNFLHTAAGLPAAAALGATGDKPTVAAIVTEYRYYSHADVICGRMLEGYAPDNSRREPRTHIVSMYTDQVPENDMSRGMATKHGFRIYPTIAEALTLGTGKLAVDAVLLIGEHGKYPNNDRGQKLYPRYELYQQIMDVFRAGGRAAPLFNDKHLSYSWERAKKMYDQSRELKFAFMAGSSIPVTPRTPDLAIPYGAKIEHAVSVGYSDLDAYGFHTLETLQCMIERRRGGEAGIASVETLEGPAVWQWANGAGKWSRPLLEAALTRAGSKVKAGRPEDNSRNPAVFLLKYRDGLETATYMLSGHVEDFLFAAQVEGAARPVACRMGIENGRQLPHFDGLVRCIEEMFVTGKPVYPVERTLLTTGALAFALESRFLKKRLETPELAIAYEAPRDTWYQRA